jgi:hypothetical protein
VVGPYPSSDARNYVGIGKQISKGTGVAPTQWAPYLPSVDLDHQLSVQKLFEASGGYRPTYTEKISEIPTGKFPILCRPSFTARLAAYLLGSDTVSGAADPFTHTIIADLVTDYLSIEQNLADEAIERFVDAAVAELVFSVDPSTRAIRCTGTWIGTNPSFQGAATAESYESANPFLISDGVFTLDGAGSSNIQGFTLTVRFVYAMPLINDVIAAHLIKVRHEVDLELIQLATDIALDYRKIHTGAVGGTTYQKIVQTGAFTADFNYGGNRQMKLEIPKVDYSGATVYTGLNPEGEEVVVTKGAHGVYNGTDPLFRYVGKNADAAAYVS